MILFSSKRLKNKCQDCLNSGFLKNTNGRTPIFPLQWNSFKIILSLIHFQQHKAWNLKDAAAGGGQETSSVTFIRILPLANRYINKKKVLLTLGGKSSRFYVGRMFVLKINSSESLWSFKAFAKLNPNTEMSSRLQKVCLWNRLHLFFQEFE